MVGRQDPSDVDMARCSSKTMGTFRASKPFAMFDGATVIPARLQPSIISFNTVPGRRAVALIPRHRERLPMLLGSLIGQHGQESGRFIQAIFSTLTGAEECFSGNYGLFHDPRFEQNIKTSR